MLLTWSVGLGSREGWAVLMLVNLFKTFKTVGVHCRKKKYFCSMDSSLEFQRNDFCIVPLYERGITFKNLVLVFSTPDGEIIEVLTEKRTFLEARRHYNEVKRKRSEDLAEGKAEVRHFVCYDEEKKEFLCAWSIRKILVLDELCFNTLIAVRYEGVQEDLIPDALENTLDSIKGLKLALNVDSSWSIRG